MDVETTLKTLPRTSGVYLMYGSGDEVLYVGKAVDLRSRVRSYFRGGSHRSAKVQVLAERIERIDYIVTNSEIEALVLENSLIKEHGPRFNVRLKDDKTYPYIKVTVTDPYPQVKLVRKRLDDRARYFGPYTDVGAVRHTLSVLQKLFPLATCSHPAPGRRNRPCLNYDIGRCLAPCVNKVSQEEYGRLMKEVLLFLAGRHEQLLPSLQQKMEQAAMQLEYEQAARLRDQIELLETVVSRQRVVASHDQDQDVIGYGRVNTLGCVQVFFVRSGRLMGKVHYLFDCNSEEEGEEIISAFLRQYYQTAATIPAQVLLPCTLSDLELFRRWLRDLRGEKVELLVPQRGEKKQLVNMANENANALLRQMHEDERRKQAEREQALLDLQEMLQLETLPKRIEAYDISTTQGSHMTGSMVVFLDGEAAKGEYRKFKIRTVADGPNDYLAMEEVIRRRFAPGATKDGGLPDLVLIDGGKGQLNAAVKGRDSVGATIPFIGLAKRFEEVFLEGQSNPVIFPFHSPALTVLQRIRDEAHRFAISYHRQLRQKAGRHSILDEIPGIGPVRKKALMHHFGSVKQIRQANREQLQSVAGINRQLAETIIQHLEQDPERAARDREL